MAKSQEDIPAYEVRKGESLESVIRGAISLAKDRRNSTRKARLIFNETELEVTRYSDVRDVMRRYDDIREHERRQPRRGSSGFCTK